MIASALTAVLGQRLVRVLCENCKEPYKPKPEFLKKANLPADKVDVFYRKPTGEGQTPQQQQQVCEVCGGTGYLGRTGIFEILVDPVAEVAAGQPIARVHDVESPARTPATYRAERSGLLIGRRWPGPTRPGDCLAVIATDAPAR